MASIDKIKRRDSTSWVARWREPNGRQRKRSFRRKVDAERYLQSVISASLSGMYVDPTRSRMTVGEWSGVWMEGRSHLKPKTLASYQSLLRTRVLPTWRDVPLACVTHSSVVTWVAAMRA